MEPVLWWGVDLIRAIQQAQGPLLDSVFKAITFLGDEMFYVIILPVLYWCVDWRMGARVGIFFLLSSFGNAGLKEIFQQPRPFELDPSVGLIHAEGFGLPSGHAQGAVALWGSIAHWVDKRWAWIVAVALMFLVGFSRIYLGVHFPTDVLAGWATGLVLLLLYMAWQPRLEAALARLAIGLQMLIAVAAPMLLLLIYPVKDTVSVMASLSGMGIGLPLMARYAPFSAHGTWQRRALRLVVGGIVAAALYLGLKAVFPGEGAALYLPFRALRYGLMGLWISLGAPWAFHRLGLAGREPSPGP